MCFVLKGAKLSVFCKSMTGKFHFKTCFETGIIGHYYNNVTPLAVGGRPFEIYHLSKHGVRGGVATSLPIATFFLNQFAFVT
ncbi:MAG: flippase-like domain-containing protein, partial [Clostridia bacterium]|nr:flippase-like domain-containing protein [Clostridia bacterium]